MEENEVIEVGLIDEVFEDDEDVINDLEETDEIDEPDDDPNIPDEDDDTGDAGGDTSAEQVQIADQVEPDEEDIIDDEEEDDLTEYEVEVQDTPITPIISNQTTMQTIGNIQAEDRVMIALVNGEPTVIGTVGSGDRQQEEINTISADVAILGTVVAGKANITDLEAATASITNLEANKASVSDLTAATGRITTLEAGKADVTDLNAATARITNLETNALTANSAVITNLQTGKADVTDLAASNARITTLEGQYADLGTVVAGKVDTNTLTANYITSSQIASNYANINAANINTATLRDAWVDKIMVQTGLIAHTGTIYTLDAIQLNADRITAGTIDVQRLVVTVNGHKYMVQFDAQGNPSYQKLDGDVIQDLTITADKIVAGAVTAEKITTANIVGTGGWINLRNGTFNYTNATSGEGISWDGTNLSINANSIYIGTTDIVTTVNNANTNASSALSTANSAQSDIDNVQTMIRQYQNGVLVCKNNNTVGALVNADGSFDVTNVSWNGSTPTAGSALATFGADVQIGASNKTHINMDYHSFQMIDKSRNEYFHVSDLRDGTTGRADVVDTWVGNGTQTTFFLGGYANDWTFDVKVDDVTVDTGITMQADRLIFDTAPLEGSVIQAFYSTDSSYAKAYTFGIRGNGDIGLLSVAESKECVASGSWSHAEGSHSTSIGGCSHAEGSATKATGEAAHAQGLSTKAKGTASHSEGYNSEAIGLYSHTEGYFTKANGKYAHAEGNQTQANGSSSHAEGDLCFAVGNYSHAQGHHTDANGNYSHAEGIQSEANGNYSHAQNNNTIASSDNQTTIGKYNIEDNSDTYAFIIGNGTSNIRSNAFAVGWNGIPYCRKPASQGYGTFGSIFDLIYPVGSIYMSVNSTSPATLFGGTWSALGGRFLIGANSTYTAGDTGGAATVSYTPAGTNADVTLTAAQSGLPAHTHGFTQPTVSGGAVTDGITGGSHSHTLQVKQTAASGTNRYHATSESGYTENTSYINSSTHKHNLPSHTHTVSGGAVGAVTGGAKAATSAHTHKFTGTAASINKMPPYLAVYMWKRTG